MKHILTLYLLGVVFTLLSVFVRLMESLEGLLGSPLPGSPWAVRGHLGHTELPKTLPEHSSRGVQ
ncbi:PREDICTED: hypoxia-inducible lipid droplet-associated protein [Chinchilla lanigera]|uniref:Hypoxia-inducible lipid droplet-associated protein n=1 Tax=Chinchilla lanigera TaxID=34839 RepID=A0A8C2V2K9_CHILA|nr:PREDICTED: hypoxia-inducible lipid droplet-associated protein [Chinchilla lanigera]